MMTTAASTGSGSSVNTGVRVTATASRKPVVRTGSHRVRPPASCAALLADGLPLTASPPTAPASRLAMPRPTISRSGLSGASSAPRIRSATPWPSTNTINARPAAVGTSPSQVPALSSGTCSCGQADGTGATCGTPYR